MIVLQIICALIAFLIIVYSLSIFSTVVASSSSALTTAAPLPSPAGVPSVTLQLPVYQDKLVVGRLLESVSQIDYPRGLLEVQVLDDSTDETSQIIDTKVAELFQAGLDIKVIRRADRRGYKSGALLNAFEKASGELIAILDADFIPPPDFLTRAIPYFLQDEKLGFLQARWGYLNELENVITRVQALFLDIHFALEKPVEQDADLFINYNGSAGILRKAAIAAIGGWDPQALSDDLDISFRMQIQGWKGRYLKDLLVKGELPDNLYSYAVQQERWAYGGIQFLRKAGKDILRAPFSLKKRAHAIAIFGGYHLFTILILQLLLSIPLVLASKSPLYSIAAIFLLFAAEWFAGIVAQQRLYPDWKSRSLYLPLMTLLVNGLALRIAWGAVKASLGKKQEFIGTPKTGFAQASWQGTDSASRVYDAHRDLSKKSTETLLTIGESILALIAAFGLWAAVARQDWLAACMYLVYTLSFVGVVIATRFKISREKKV